MPMDKRQKQALKECDSSGCIYMPRCTVFYGKRCKNLEGRKIPRFRPKDIDHFVLYDVQIPTYRTCFRGGA